MGRVINHYNVSGVLAWAGEITVTEMVDNHVAHVLNVMPPGTKHISTDQDMIYGTFIPFTITFEHPLFEDGTVVELNYERDLYVDKTEEKEKVVQLSVFTGIKYKKPDGSLRYSDNL